ncbi:TAFII28-domain-containing protein [Endogone sp. FLAS-F59071]|nr:TAFII28-domain-containing protein [Endogone sp. FLAS-F59071]|eukprot:RUS21120.1 TAFII28-domain-containing protein [Endogone sp. FLAS-F59071]
MSNSDSTVPTLKRRASFTSNTPAQRPKVPAQPPSSSKLPKKSILKKSTSQVTAPSPASSQDSQLTRDTSVPLSESQEGADEDMKVEGQEPTDKDAKPDDQAAEESEEEEAKDLVADLEWQALANRNNEEMKVLLEAFSPEQLHRYEAYRRSKLDKTNLVSQVLNQQCSATMAFVVAGFAKVFVGEIIEKAREVMEEWGETGPIRPDHLREARRRYDIETGLPAHNYQKRLFTR